VWKLHTRQTLLRTGTCCQTSQSDSKFLTGRNRLTKIGRASYFGFYHSKQSAVCGYINSGCWNWTIWVGSIRHLCIICCELLEQCVCSTIFATTLKQCAHYTLTFRRFIRALHANAAAVTAAIANKYNSSSSIFCCLSSAMHGQNINLPVYVCVCVCPSHFLSTRLQVRHCNLYLNP